MSSINAQQFIDAVEQEFKDLADEARADLKSLLTQIEPLVSEFVAAGDTKQLEVINLRVRQYLRERQGRAIIAQSNAIQHAISTGLRILIAAI